MKTRLKKIGELIKIQRDNDVIVIHPINRAWYYTTAEGWEIFRMASQGEETEEIAKKTLFTREEIRTFLQDIERVLFLTGKKTVRSLSCTINLTNNCNMKCRHCRYSSGRYNDYLDSLLARKYVKEAIKEGATHLTITGGEPFTKWQNCREIIEYARSLNRELRIQILTNGSLITPEIARELRNLDISIQVSLDSINEEKFRSFRGFPLRPVLKGIKILLKEGVRVTISTVLARVNIDEIEDIISFAIEEGIGGIHFPFLEKGGRGKENWEEIQLSDEELISLLARLTTIYFDDNLRSQISFEDFESIIKRVIYPSLAGRCKCGSEVSALSPDGKIYPCTNLVGDSQYCLGSISEIPLEEIRKSSLITQLPTINDIKDCKNCEVGWLCLGGCKDRIQLMYGNLYNPDPYCKVFKWWLKEMLFRTAELVEKNEI